MTKIYSFNINREVNIAKTPTIVAFVKSMIDLTKNTSVEFSAMDVINNALDKNLWTTKQTTEVQLMNTWAFYVKKLKSYGMIEVSSVKNVESVNLGDIEDSLT